MASVPGQAMDPRSDGDLSASRHYGRVWCAFQRLGSERCRELVRFDGMADRRDPVRSRSLRPSGPPSRSATEDHLTNCTTLRGMSVQAVDPTGEDRQSHAPRRAPQGIPGSDRRAGSSRRTPLEPLLLRRLGPRMASTVCRRHRKATWLLELARVYRISGRRGNIALGFGSVRAAHPPCLPSRPGLPCTASTAS